MALEIFVPNSPYSDQRVSLGEEVLIFEYKYNSRNSSWYLNLYDAQKENLVVSGIKVMPNQNLTGRYIIPELTSGEIWCIRTKSSQEPLGRDNFGIGKTYSMFYFSDEDPLESIANEFIQL